MKGLREGMEQPTKFELVINLKAAKQNRSHDPAERAGASGSSDQMRREEKCRHVVR